MGQRKVHSMPKTIFRALRSCFMKKVSLKHPKVSVIMEETVIGDASLYKSYMSDEQDSVWPLIGKQFYQLPNDTSDTDAYYKTPVQASSDLLPKYFPGSFMQELDSVLLITPKVSGSLAYPKKKIKLGCGQDTFEKFLKVEATFRLSMCELMTGSWELNIMEVRFQKWPSISTRHPSHKMSDGEHQDNQVQPYTASPPLFSSIDPTEQDATDVASPIQEGATNNRMRGRKRLRKKREKRAQMEKPVVQSKQRPAHRKGTAGSHHNEQPMPPGVIQVVGHTKGRGQAANQNTSQSGKQSSARTSSSCIKQNNGKTGACGGGGDKPPDDECGKKTLPLDAVGGGDDDDDDTDDEGIVEDHGNNGGQRGVGMGMEEKHIPKLSIPATDANNGHFLAYLNDGAQNGQPSPHTGEYLRAYGNHLSENQPKPTPSPAENACSFTNGGKKQVTISSKKITKTRFGSYEDALYKRSPSSYEQRRPDPPICDLSGRPFFEPCTVAHPPSSKCASPQPEPQRAQSSDARGQVVEGQMSSRVWRGGFVTPDSARGGSDRELTNLFRENYIRQASLEPDPEKHFQLLQEAALLSDEDDE